MARFVTFDDGFGTYNFRAIFPSNTTKKEILKAVSRKMSRYLAMRGLDKDDFDWSKLNYYTTITNMKEGRFYQPEFGEQWNN